MLTNFFKAGMNDELVALKDLIKKELLLLKESKDLKLMKEILDLKKFVMLQIKDSI